MKIILYGLLHLWKDPDTGVISRTSSRVEIEDSENWIYGSVPFELQGIFVTDGTYKVVQASHQPKVVKYFSSASLPGKRGI